MSEINATTDNGNNGADKKPTEPKLEAPLSRSSSETLKRPAEPEFVLVKDLISGELMELPTLEADNTLGLATLTHAFPGSHGLKYLTNSGTTRALLIDSTGQKFYPPADNGWSGKTFTVIFNNLPSVNSAPVAPDTAKLRSNSDQNAKRKKMMDENESSDSESGHHSSHSGQVTAKQKRMESVKHEEKKDDKDEHHCTDLIVLGLPFKLTEKDLNEHFGQFGKLTLCEIKKDGKGASKGFGFIQFEDFESQLRVLARPVHTIGGRRCEVRIPFSKKGDGRSEYGGIEHAKLFIGRLQEKTSETSLKEFFLSEARKIDPKANIIDTFIPKPFRSFAFITFSSPKIVKEMIKKGDFIIDGSSVSVSSAAPKTAESSSSHSGYASERSYPDYPYPGEWSRSTMHRPTTQFNEQAFVRPYEQRKRTFMETAYGIPNEYNSPTPGMLPPSSGGGGSQALASGFETLNLNQLPANNHEMMTAFSQYLSTQGARAMPPPQPQQMPRYPQSHLHIRGRHDHNPRDYRSQYQSPYSRDDNYY